MYNIELNEVKAHISDLIGIALSGEEIFITQNNQPVLKFIRLSPPEKCRKAGSAKGLIKMSDDFDEPLEDFGEYMK